MVHSPETVKKTILIVDDETFYIVLLLSYLNPDYQVIVAKNGETALKRAQSDDKPALISLVILIPDMNRYEVCSRLKQNNETRIFLLFLSWFWMRPLTKRMGLKWVLKVCKVLS